MSTRQKIFRIVLICAVCLLICISAHAKSKNKGKKPKKKPKYSIEITSDKETYTQGETAEFTIEVSRKQGKKATFSMKGKYLIGWFPTKDTEAELEQVSKDTWEFNPVLKESGEQTLTVELRHDHRRAISRIQRSIDRFQTRIDWLERLLEKVNNP